MMINSSLQQQRVSRSLTAQRSHRRFVVSRPVAVRVQTNEVGWTGRGLPASVASLMAVLASQNLKAPHTACTECRSLHLHLLRTPVPAACVVPHSVRSNPGKQVPRVARKRCSQYLKYLGVSAW